MAFNNIVQSTPVADVLVEIETDPSSIGRSPTIEDNVTGNSGGLIYMVEIDNHLNVDNTYVKFRFSASESSLVGTEAHMILLAPGREIINYAFPGGVQYTTGLTGWVTTSAALSAATLPISKVTVKILAT